MKPHANLSTRLALGLTGLGGLMWFGAACAQVLPAATPSPPASLSAANSPASGAYQDRYIGGGSLTPDISTGDGATDDTAALARSVQIDAITSRLTSRSDGSNSTFSESGVIAKAQWDTAAYGAWSLDASARAAGSDNIQSGKGQGGVVTLRERGLPFDGNWQADNAIGDLNAPDIGLVRLQSRFVLPTGPMQGFASEWRGPSDFQITAGGGIPGIYDGILVPDFRTLNGSTATAGAQCSPATHWTIGGQFIDARDVNLAVGSTIDNASLLSS